MTKSGRISTIPNSFEGNVSIECVINNLDEAKRVQPKIKNEEVNYIFLLY